MQKRGCSGTSRGEVKKGAERGWDVCAFTDEGRSHVGMRG